MHPVNYLKRTAYSPEERIELAKTLLSYMAEHKCSQKEAGQVYGMSQVRSNRVIREYLDAKNAKEKPVKKAHEVAMQYYDSGLSIIEAAARAMCAEHDLVKALKQRAAQNPKPRHFHYS